MYGRIDQDEARRKAGRRRGLGLEQDMAWDVGLGRAYGIEDGRTEQNRVDRGRAEKRRFFVTYRHFFSFALGQEQLVPRSGSRQCFKIFRCQFSEVKAASQNGTLSTS